MHFKLLKNKEKTQEKTVLKNQKKQEKSRGRSMVEMLGVLAIIGVLSIGGITGYTLAMRRYQANEILNAANKYAAIIWTYAQKKLIDDPENYYWINNAESDPSEKYQDVSDELQKNIDHLWLVHYAPDHLEHYAIPYSYSDAGIGTLPSGAIAIAPEIITAGKSGVIVSIAIGFQDKQLCETVKSMMDIAPDSEITPCIYGQSTAINRTDCYSLLVPFYQK